MEGHLGVARANFTIEKRLPQKSDLARGRIVFVRVG
jgi:hypothetical protein